MPKRTESYQVALLEALKDSEEAAAYLNAALEEGEDAEALFLRALRNVAEARGITKIAAAAALNRESV